jgi:hypothetical protein
VLSPSHGYTGQVTRRAVATVVAACAIAWPREAGAIITPLTRADMERATALARWPRSDSDRARFHKPYIIPLTGATTDLFKVTTVEVITEFRRLELIAEEHARANDNFARGGLRDAEEAIKPFQGHVSIVARLELGRTNRYAGDPPAVDIAIGDTNPMAPLSTKATGVYAKGTLTGVTVEATFAAPRLRARRAPVILSFNGQRLTRIVINFGELE